MVFVPRAKWAARPATTSTDITPVGVALHWEGPHMGTPAHADCAERVRGIQRYHMDTNGWADIAYSAIVCPHGYVFEGRGKGRRTAANGTTDGNQRYYAVCYLGGERDPFTDAAQAGFRAAIDWLGGGKVLGHRDLVATACPGDEIYAWLSGGTAPAPAMPAPVHQQKEILTMIMVRDPRPGKGGKVYISVNGAWVHVKSDPDRLAHMAVGVPYISDVSAEMAEEYFGN